MTKDLPTVVFDVGAVLIGLNYGKTENSFFAQASKISGISYDGFKAWYSELEKRCLLGQVNAQEHYDALREKLKSPQMSQDELEALVSLLWIGQIDSTVKLKQRIHEKGYGVGILSNMTDYALDILFKKYQDAFETWGGKTVFSFEHGVIKPDLELYRQFDEVPGNKVFIDDNYKYARAPVEGLNDWSAVNFIEHLDKEEGIRQVQAASEINMPVSGLYIARNHEELLEALDRLGVHLN